MSYREFKKAIKKAAKCDFYTTAGGKSDQEIEKAEVMFGKKFCNQYREFCKEYGYMSFSGFEIFGIDPDDESGILEGNSVAYAKNDREEFGLPEDWLPIFNYDDGNMAYLDFSSLNKDGEPRVIIAFFDGEEYQIESTIAEDFGKFLLKLVKSAR